MLSQVDSGGAFKLVQSDLLECDAHLQEICDIMCVASAGEWVWIVLMVSGCGHYWPGGMHKTG